MSTAQYCHDGNQVSCVDLLPTMLRLRVRVLRLILIYLSVVCRYLSGHTTIL